MTVEHDEFHPPSYNQNHHAIRNAGCAMTEKPVPNHPISVLLADSSQLRLHLLTSALRRRPELKVESCPLDVDIILKALEIPTEVLVLAGNAQGGNWKDMALLRRLHVSYPGVAKILLLESFGREVVVNAFRSGARGLFCFTESSFRSLCRCIQVVHRGEIWANAEQIDYLVDLVSQVPSLRVVNARGTSLLTPREEQVVALVAEGLSNREVALELGLSEHTIKKYLFRIFDKLGISTRVELVLYAVAHGNQRVAEWLPAVSG